MGSPSSEASGSTPARRSSDSRAAAAAVRGSSDTRFTGCTSPAPGARRMPRGSTRLPPGDPSSAENLRLEGPPRSALPSVRLTQDVSAWRARKGGNRSPACTGRTRGSTELHPRRVSTHRAAPPPKWGVSWMNHSDPASTSAGSSRPALIVCCIPPSASRARAADWSVTADVVGGTVLLAGRSDASSVELLVAHHGVKASRNLQNIHARWASSTRGTIFRGCEHEPWRLGPTLWRSVRRPQQRSLKSVLL